MWIIIDEKRRFFIFKTALRQAIKNFDKLKEDHICMHLFDK